MAHWTDEYITMIDDCESRESRLTEWEVGFCDSLRKQIEAGKMPTPKQIESLNKVWERATARG